MSTRSTLSDVDGSANATEWRSRRRRRTTLGEVLYDAGDKSIPLFVVVSGELQVVRPEPGDTLIATHARSQFSGECAVVTGRSSICHPTAPG